MAALQIVGSSFVNALTASGALVATVVAALVFVDARGGDVEYAPAWAAAVGAASFAGFLVADAVAVSVWAALNANPDGPVVATTPVETLTYGVGVGVLLTLLVLFGYGLGTRRSTGA